MKIIKLIDKIPRWIAIAVFTLFLLFVSYGLSKQYENGFISPYHFGERGVK